MTIPCSPLPRIVMGTMVLSSFLGASAVNAQTLYQSVDTLPSDGMFEAFDLSLGSLTDVIFTYKIRFDSTWSTLSECKSQGGRHDCIVSWDFGMEGVNGFEGLSDDLGGVFTVDGLNQFESRTFSGSISFNNLDDFLGTPGDRVGGVAGTLVDGNIGYVEYPQINGKHLLNGLNWFVENTLTYHYQPHATDPEVSDPTQVPEPSLLLGLMTLGLAVGGCRSQRG